MASTPPIFSNTPSNRGRRSLELERESPSVPQETYQLLLEAYKKQKIENGILSKALLEGKDKVMCVLSRFVFAVLSLRVFVLQVVQAESVIKEKEVWLHTHPLLLTLLPCAGGAAGFGGGERHADVQ